MGDDGQRGPGFFDSVVYEHHAEEERELFPAVLSLSLIHI